MPDEGKDSEKYKDDSVYYELISQNFPSESCDGGFFCCFFSLG